MEPKYVVFRTPGGCLMGVAAVLVAFATCAVASAFELPKWMWIAMIVPPAGLLLAMGLVLDRRRGGRERPSAPEGPFGCTWFAIYLVVSIASGALVIAWLTPMMKEMSALGRVSAFLLGIGIATVFSRGIMGMLQRLRGDGQDRE